MPKFKVIDPATTADTDIQRFFEAHVASLLRSKGIPAKVSPAGSVFFFIPKVRSPIGKRVRVTLDVYPEWV